MSKDLEQIVKRIGLAMDDKTICLIHFAEVEMRSDGYTATCSKLCDVADLKKLASAYTKAVNDLTTERERREELEVVAAALKHE